MVLIPHTPDPSEIDVDTPAASTVGETPKIQLPLAVRKNGILTSSPYNPASQAIKAMKTLYPL